MTRVHKIAAAATVLCSSACAPIPDRFASTSAACAQGRSPDCDAHLADDFGAHGMEDWWFDGAAELVWLCEGLSDEVEVDEYVREPVLDWMSAAPGDTPGAQLYNRVAAATDQTIHGDLGNASANYHAGTVTWEATGMSAPDMALTIVHEAGHEVGPDHRPCPGASNMNCDRSWRGSYAKEVAAAAWASELADTPERQGIYSDKRDLRRSQILAD